MKRREFITLVGGAAAWPLSAQAQLRAMPVIGVLMGVPLDDPLVRSYLQSFERGLEEQGLRADNNVHMELRGGTADVDQASKNAKELIALKPNVIVVASTPGVAALLRESNSTAIVFVNVADPIGSGFVAGMARPGGNLTGFTNFETSMASKWLEVLIEIAPTTRRVLALFDPNTTPNAAYLQTTEAAAGSTALELSTAAVRDTREVEIAISTFAQKPNGGVVVFPDVYTVTHRHFIIGLMEKQRLPAVYGFRFFPVDGGLASYGLEPFEPFRRAATYVDRILRGEKPADLPVQQPTKFELVINLKAAKALGLTIPQALLARADEVIE